MADTSETKIKKEIVVYLDSLKPDLWHTAMHNVGYTRKGIPDRLCCYKGLFFALEIKAPGKKPTPWQEREIADISEAGGIAQVVYSAADVMAIIKQIDWKF